MHGFLIVVHANLLFETEHFSKASRHYNISRNSFRNLYLYNFLLESYLSDLKRRGYIKPLGENDDARFDMKESK